jgi:hypothetical protein
MPDTSALLMSHEELLTHLSDSADSVEHTLAGGDYEEWCPQLLVWTKSHPRAELKISGYSLMVGEEWNDKMSRGRFLNKIGRMLYKEKLLPFAAVLMSEAWMARERKGAPHLELKDNPAREEVIMVMGSTAGNKHCAVIAIPIDRIGGKMHCLPRIVQSVGVSSPLLAQFWNGFFAEVVRK